VTTIYAIEANNVREINFPSESTDHWGRMGDVLSMPAEALRENSDGGLVRLVCFAYNNLEHVSSQDTQFLKEGSASISFYTPTYPSLAYSFPLYSNGRWTEVWSGKTVLCTFSLISEKVSRSAVSALMVRRVRRLPCLRALSLHSMGI
jgi:hypothetical protein